MDDIILIGNNNLALTKFISAIGNTFAFKDLDNLHYFLGVDLIRTSDGLFLLQQHYIRNLLERFNMSNAKPVSTPLSSSISLKNNDGSNFVDASLFRQLIGALQYITLTCQDICFSVNKLNQFLHQPTQLHWQAVKRLLRYLKDSVFFGLQFHSNSNTLLTEYTDSDWRANLDDRSSTSAYVIFFYGNPVS